jgi:(S)-ureidoglycine aminohydrolase
MKGCSAIVHTSPAMGAGFAQYVAEFEVGGELGGTNAQRFIFVMEGAVKLDTDDGRHELRTRGYAYVPQAPDYSGRK